jgi:predicted phosphate transport protein (TIGR00153 family)
MFGWFQRLLPKSDDFFAMFERHAAATVVAAESLVALAHGRGDMQQHIDTIRDREHDADEIIREVLGAVRQTFLTPFDRGAITALIGAMDDVIDEIQAAASAIELYEVTDFTLHQQQMANVALKATGLIAQAMPLLRDVQRNGNRLHELTGQIVTLEGDVDLLHQGGLKVNFHEQRGNPDPVTFIVAREIYKHLEKIADAFEDVANEIDGLVIDHA